MWASADPPLVGSPHAIEKCLAEPCAACYEVATSQEEPRQVTEDGIVPSPLARSLCNAMQTLISFPHNNHRMAYFVTMPSIAKSNSWTMLPKTTTRYGVLHVDGDDKDAHMVCVGSEGHAEFPFHSP